jgi:hypothetical protein
LFHGSKQSQGFEGLPTCVELLIAADEGIIRMNDLLMLLVAAMSAVSNLDAHW